VPKTTKYIVIRAVTSEDCPWLGDEVVPVGTEVTKVDDMYGCCGPGGVFVEYPGMRCPTELPAGHLQMLPGTMTIISKKLN
jgi:hypothetical protein